ncbi:MAG TPA: hypothetical protein PLB38_01280 [bacterium]|nr:hypothetical protein [bacterium]
MNAHFDKEPFVPAAEELRHFTYFDYFKNREVIFECDAKGILEADELYKKATGKDPAKQSDVGCTVGKIIENNS